MKQTFLLISFLLAIATAFSQTDDAAKYAGIITGAELQKHLAIIASDEMEGRETGTEGQRKAAAYIEAQFKQLGLVAPKGLKGYQQLYPLYQDSMISSTLTIDQKTAEYATDYISSPMSNESANERSSQLVFAGYGIEDKSYSDYTGLDVRGKIVVFILGEPKTADGKFLLSGTTRGSQWSYPGLSKKIALAASRGATAVLVINPAMESFSQRQLDQSKKSNVYFPEVSKDEKVNYAILSHAFARTIFGTILDSLVKKAKAGGEFSKADAWEKKIKTVFNYKKLRTVINASNVLGIIEGTDKKDEYVFLTGHYDHLGKRGGKIYYGADDDGSGTVGVIQMAAAFAKAKAEGKGPRRTVVFMTVSGEEKGLWGSEYYSEHPVYPLDKTSVDLNTDMVGRIDTERKAGDTMNYVYVVGHDKLSSELPLINEAVNKKYTGLTLDYKFDDPNDKERIYFRSDHYNFARKGVPVLFFYDGMLKADYHKPTDTIDKITWSLYEKRVRMIFHTAWEMANRDEMLKRDIPLQEATR
jgi:Zn-dependent M28 family amino/carboxypeptidase